MIIRLLANLSPTILGTDPKKDDTLLHRITSPIKITQSNLAPEVSIYQIQHKNIHNVFKIATRSDEIVYRMISPEKPDPTAVFVPDNKEMFHQN